MKWLGVALVAPMVMLGVVLVPLVFLGVIAAGNIPTMTAAASQAATSEIPPVALAAYQTAAPTCPGLSWTILAGIGKVETGHGTANGHHLDETGQAVPSSPVLRSNASNGPLGYAYGPMQFLSATWAFYGPLVAPGLDQADMETGPVQNIGFAAHAAALLLCRSAGGQIANEAALHQAIDAYSGSTDGYYDAVTTVAALYGQTGSTSDPTGPPTAATPTSGLRTVLAALHFVGIPYANGNPAHGDPGIQFSGHPGDTWVVQHFGAQDPRYATLDCSGLVNATMYLAYNLSLNYCSADYLHDPRFRHVSMSELQMGDIVTRGGCGPTGHIAIVAYVDPTGLVSIVDAARHGTVVGFRAQQDPRTWRFTDAVRYEQG